MPSQAEIRCECAFTYMNAVSGKTLTGGFSPMESTGRGPRHRTHSPQCSGRSAVLPDDGDMHLRRERPPKIRRGTMIGGWQRGSLTPQMPPSLLLTAAPTPTRAANSAARLTVVKLLIAKNIAVHRLTQSRSSRGSLISEPRTSKGDHCSEVCVPPSFSSLSSILAASGRARTPGRETRLEGAPTPSRM